MRRNGLNLFGSIKNQTIKNFEIILVTMIVQIPVKIAKSYDVKKIFKIKKFLPVLH